MSAIYELKRFNIMRNTIFIGRRDSSKAVDFFRYAASKNILITIPVSVFWMTL